MSDNCLKKGVLRAATALLSFPIALPVFAQQELLLHSSPEIWHSNATNPAFFPEEKKFVLGLPGQALDASHSGSITYGDFFVKNENKTVVDFGEVIDKLDPSNKVQFDQRVETVSLGVRLPFKFALQAGHAMRFSGAAIYPQSLLQLLWNGNGPYIGEELGIAPSVSLARFNEWSLGLSRKIGAVNLGARVKYLTGTNALSTDPAHASASVYTSPDIYQLTLNTDYAFYSSSIITAFDTSGYGFDLQFADFKSVAFTRNTGVAFDLGLHASIGERLSFDASILDIGGKITWDADSDYYISQGSYTYEGQVFPGVDIVNGGENLNFETKLDSLNDIFKFSRTAASFETTLPLRAYAGVNFDLTKKLALGVSGYLSDRPGEENDTYALGASARYQIIKPLAVAAMISVNQRNVANLGLQVFLRPGPVQLYFTSDNLLSAFNPTNNPAVNFRFGAALAL